MTDKPKDSFAEWEEEEADRRRKAYDAEMTPERRARDTAKAKEEFDAGVRNGLWDEDGTPIGEPDEKDDEE